MEVYAGRVVFHDGDVELAPGLSLHRVGGHTDGLQVVRVHTEVGWIVLASDATHYYENFTAGRPFPIVFDVGAMLEGYDDPAPPRRRPRARRPRPRSRSCSNATPRSPPTSPASPSASTPTRHNRPAHAPAPAPSVAHNRTVRIRAPTSTRQFVLSEKVHRPRPCRRRDFGLSEFVHRRRRVDSFCPKRAPRLGSSAERGAGRVGVREVYPDSWAHAWIRSHVSAPCGPGRGLDPVFTSRTEFIFAPGYEPVKGQRSLVRCDTIDPDHLPGAPSTSGIRERSQRDRGERHRATTRRGDPVRSTVFACST